MTRVRRDRSRAPKGGDGGTTPSQGGLRNGNPVSPLSRLTGIFGGAGVVVALTGFYLLSQGSIGLAPLLLAIAFLVLFPLALVK